MPCAAPLLIVGCAGLPAPALAPAPGGPRQDASGSTTVTPPGKDVRVGIGVMSAGGSGRTVLAEGPARVMMAPALSPDGKRIAFAALGKDNRRSDVYVMNRDGSGRKRLTEQGPETYAT